MESGDADGQSLYKMLLSPATVLLHPNAPVIILADGILGQLNFETLLVPGAAPGTPPIATSSVKMHYLLGDLIVGGCRRLRNARCRRAYKTGSSKDTFDRQSGLPGSGFTVPFRFFRLEMCRIEGHFSSSDVSTLEGQQATPPFSLFQQPRNYTYLVLFCRPR